MKMSRRERKAYNAGHDDGYIEGYKQGLEDGNPFITIAKAITETINSFAETVTSEDFKRAVEKALQAEKEMEEYDRFLYPNDKHTIC